MESSLECYGNAEKCGKLADCERCEFSESCALYAGTESSMDSRSGHVSYEAYSFNREVSGEAEQDELLEPPQHEIDEKELKYSDDDLLRLMHFILRIDDYALGVVESVINSNLLTASETAKAFNVSRQAMHRKIIDSVRKNPELRTVFRANLYRCKKLRDENLNHGFRIKKSAVEQLELFS